MVTSVVTTESRVVIAGESDRREWDEFVAAHPCGSIYHTFDWRAIIRNAYGHEPNYFMLRGDDNRICGVLPVFAIHGHLTASRLCAVPAAQYAPPLATNASDLVTLLQAAVRAAGKTYLEIRSPTALPITMDLPNVRHRRWFGHQLDLSSDLDTIWAGFHKSCVARAIRKGSASRVELRSVGGITELYRLYARMRRRKGMLPQPRRFFESLWNVLAPQGMAEVVLAVLDEKPIAAILLLKHHNAVYCEYGAVEPRGRSTCSMHLLLWHAIQEAKRSGATIFDFGRTSIDNSGLRQFKLRWGARELSIEDYLLGVKSSSGTFRDRRSLRVVMYLAVRLFPLTVSNTLANVIYRDLV